MAKGKTELNIHAGRYVQSVFENRLREEGFTCPDEKRLCWYRLNNGEIVNSIVFFSVWSNMPLMLSVGYGIHPLFQKPVYTGSVNFPKRPIEAEHFLQQPLVENRPINAMGYIRYAEDIQVMAPGCNGRGIFTFDEILLPQMNSVESVETCYLRHKNKRLNYKHDDIATKFASISDIFVDEAIWVGDTEIYPYCIARTNNLIELYQQYCKNDPDNKRYHTELHSWELRKSALVDGTRREYLKVLEKRKLENRACMKKKRMI